MTGKWGHFGKFVKFFLPPFSLTLSPPPVSLGIKSNRFK